MTRSEDGGKFKTIISPDINKYQKIIPPMLIQPIIENSFEHAFNESVANPKIVLEINRVYPIYIPVKRLISSF